MRQICFPLKGASSTPSITCPFLVIGSPSTKIIHAQFIVPLVLRLCHCRRHITTHPRHCCNPVSHCHSLVSLLPLLSPCNVSINARDRHCTKAVGAWCRHPTAHPRHKCTNRAKPGGEGVGVLLEGSGALGSETKCCEGGRPPRLVPTKLWLRLRPPRRDGHLGGPNYTKCRIITKWKQQIYILVTVSGIYSYSKTGEMNLMYNNSRLGEQ